jgi:membrane protein DedA with SNARE-associated domain
MTSEAARDGSRAPEQQWLHLERKILDKIDKTIQYYERQQARSRKLFRTLGVIAIVVAALAPISL